MTGDEKLDHMANQIADFFRPYPRDEAVAGIHEHIVAFWSPAMRRDLGTRIAAGTARLDDLVVAAFRTSASGTSPVHREAAGPADVGEVAASDAG